MKTKLELNKELYTLPSIQKAIVAYNGLAHITVEENATHYLCFFSRCRYEADVTKQEFANYLIDLLNSKESL